MRCARSSFCDQPYSLRLMCGRFVALSFDFDDFLLFVVGGLGLGIYISLLLPNLASLASSLSSPCFRQNRESERDRFERGGRPSRFPLARSVPRGSHGELVVRALLCAHARNSLLPPRSLVSQASPTWEQSTTQEKESSALALFLLPRMAVGLFLFFFFGFIFLLVCG